jgi:hypothetical protein
MNITKNLQLKWKGTTWNKNMKRSNATQYIMQNCDLFMPPTTDSEELGACYGLNTQHALERGGENITNSMR